MTNEELNTALYNRTRFEPGFLTKKYAVLTRKSENSRRRTKNHNHQ